MWSSFFLILTSISGILYTSRRIIYKNHLRIVSISLLIAVIIGAISDFELHVNIADIVETGALSYATLAALVMLLLIVHYKKPEHVRSSVWYSYIPLIIFPALVFLVDSVGLLSLLFMILQGTALIVSFFVIFLYTGNLKRSFSLIAGIVVLLSGYCVYWFLDLNVQLLETITNLCIGTGILLVSYSLPELINRNVRD